MNKSTLILSALLLTGLTLGGCAKQRKYDDLVEANQTLSARNEQLVQDTKTAQLSLERKQARIDELEAEMRQLKAIRDGLMGDVGSLSEKQKAIQDAFGNLKLTALNPETDKALQALADQYKDIIRYDASRGMLQFLADLTFDSGSDTVKPQAKEGLTKLAGILRSSSASEYDLRIVGHTDNQPISNPSTAKRFGTNRHLSAFRAIAVEEALRSGGLSPSRMEIAGWGEYRPVVPNNARGGTGPNRRVEIYVVPSTSSSAGSDTGGQAAPASTAPAHSKPQEMPFK